MIKLAYYGDLRELTHLRGEESNAATMKALLRGIKERHGPAAAKAASRSVITLNGVRVDKPNSSQPIPENSEVCFFPLCSGG